MKTQLKEHYDYIIIGGGPAGLQLGYFFEKAGRDYVILEGGERPGSFFVKLPRRRLLISINKIYTGYDDPEINLRWDWNSLLGEDAPRFKSYSREYMPHPDRLVDYLGDYAAQYDLKIACDTRVEKIKKDERFELTTNDGTALSCERLIVATGMAKPYIPEIPGIELAEQYVSMSVDPEDFANQRVLVIGKGNSGFETADNLIATTSLVHVLSRRPISLAWKTHHVGHLRAVNNNFLDTYQLKTQNAVLDATIQSIEKRGDEYAVAVDYTHAQGEHEDLFYDRILCCTGFRFDNAIFDESANPELVLQDRFPALTSSWESTNVEGLYFAGALMQSRDYKKAASAFIHGFRYNVRTLHRLHEKKYHDEPLPRREIDASPEGLVEAMLARVNRSSGLWQQFGVLGDLIAVSPDGEVANYFEELPVDYIHDSDLGQHGTYYVLTLEFGKVAGDPFNIERKPDPDYARESVFLHPVVRHYSGREFLSEHHLLENLYGEWKDLKEHEEPLLDYVRRTAGEAQTVAGEPLAAAEAVIPA